jgi:c-di-GMP-binding flagellar brake protein YcgR
VWAGSVETTGEMASAPTQGAPAGIETGPPPATDQEIWIEGLVGAPLGSIVLALSDDLVRFEPPRIAGREVPLPLAQDFKITYRLRGVRCEVRAVIVQGPSVGDHSYVARMTASPTRIQRRKDVRVPANLQVILRDASEPDSPSRITGTTVNVSVAGVLVSATREMTPGQTFQGALNCGQHGLLAMRLRVVWASRDDHARTWQAGMRILEMEQDARRRLSAYVLERQRVLRRRELGLE